MNLVAICHKCPKRSPPPYTGAMLCTMSGKNILEHVAKRQCPLGWAPEGGDPYPPVEAADTRLPEPLPRSEWSMLVQLIARFSTDQDAGVGDTVHRAASAIGADLVSRMLREAGVECGCAARRRWLNARYPY